MTTDRHWFGDLSLAVLLVLPTAALAFAQAPAFPNKTSIVGAHAAAPAVGPSAGRVGLLG